MDSQSLANVLSLLRLIKADQSGRNAIDLINSWAGMPIPESTVLKIASYLSEQIESAQIVIRNSQLSEEAKEGLLATLERMRAAYSISGMQSPPRNHISDVASAVSNFAILLSAINVSSGPETPQEAKDIIKDINELMGAFEDEAIDPILRDVAKKHLATLSTLLQHVPIFGIEAALTAYFDMVMKLRRAETKAGPATKGKMDKLWGELKKMSDRLGVLDKLFNQGARALEKANESGLLEYLPDL